MLIAFLALLGVDLIIIVAFVLLVLSRKRWVKRQPGAFAGAIRVAGGDVEGLGEKWKRGHGRWVRDVLVWTKAPFHFRNELVPIDRLTGERAARDGEVRRLGDAPVVIELASDEATIEVAAGRGDAELVPGPYRRDRDRMVEVMPARTAQATSSDEA